MLTRTMLMYLVDPSTRPDPEAAVEWIEKRKATMTPAQSATLHYGKTIRGTRPKRANGYDRWNEEGLRFCKVKTTFITV